MKVLTPILSVLVLLISLSCSGQGNLADHFVTTWKTDNPGTSNNTSITIPTYSGETYNYDVDWDNDGVFDQFGITGDVTYGFGVAGVYTIRLRGQFPRIYFSSSNLTDQEKLLDVGQWGTNPWSSMEFAFSGCASMDVSANDMPDLSLVNSTLYMFAGCSSLIANGSIANWDVSNVTVMHYMFRGASFFNQPVDSWDISNVTSMFGMFSGAATFNQPVGSWDVSNVIFMNSMFADASSFNQPLGSWDVRSVTNMAGMFAKTNSFNQPLDSWNVDSVTNMAGMFFNAVAYNQPISSWNVGNVTDMEHLFDGAVSFNQPLDTWDLSGLTELTYMFRGASSFNSPIGSWDVSGVTDMSYMFQDASSFDQPLNSWNVSNVITMWSMFKGASSFNQPLSNWSVNQVISMYGMFNDALSFDQNLGSWKLLSLHWNTDMFVNCGLSTSSYDSLLNGWADAASQGYDFPKKNWNMLGLMYCSGAAARDALIQLNWTFGGDSLDPNCTINFCSEDINGDGIVKYIGAGNDRDLILQFIGGSVPTNVVPCSGCPEDINDDGLVKYIGANNDRDLILQRIGGAIPTSVYTCP